MDKKVCIFVQCIVPDSPEISELILQSFQRKASEHCPDLLTVLYSSIDYWKYEGYKSVTLKISTPSIISVKDIMQFFLVTWHFSQSDVHNIDINHSYEYQSGIWNKFCHPSEMFLLPSIEWVHIYTGCDY